MRVAKLLITIVLGAGGSVLAVAPAAASIPGPSVGGANTCAGGSDSISAGYCLAPTQWQVNPSQTVCPPFPDGRQWQNTTDLNKVPELWTYPNGNTACVEVGYTPSTTYDHCDFYFYVPWGPLAKSSTSLVAFSYEDVTGTWHSATLDESPVRGWQLAFSSGVAVQWIDFTDANGRGPTTSQEIAWNHDGAAHGIWEFCAKV